MPATMSDEAYARVRDEILGRVSTAEVPDAGTGRSLAECRRRLDEAMRTVSAQDRTIATQATTIDIYSTSAKATNKSLDGLVGRLGALRQGFGASIEKVMEQNARQAEVNRGVGELIEMIHASRRDHARRMETMKAMSESLRQMPGTVAR